MLRDSLQLPVDTGARIEAGLLAALVFVLPLWEAPKNLLAVAFVLAWLVNRLRAHDFGGPWDRWDTLIAAWIGSGFLVAAFAGIHAQEWRGTSDLVRYGLVLWCVKRSRPADGVVVGVIAVAALATAIGLAWGYAKWVMEPRRVYIELHSVGHVNHSAIYLAIILGATTSLFLGLWPRLGTVARIAALASLALLFVFLVAMASRAATVAGLVLVALLAMAWWPRNRLFAGAAAVGVATAVFGLIALRPPVVTKHLQNMHDGNVLSFRDQIWATSSTALRTHPWFGIGMDNFSKLDIDRVRGWSEALGRPFDDGLFFFAPHAHSLYFNALAERGIVGSAVLVAVLAAWLVSLVRGYPGRGGSDCDWIAWGAAFSGWFVTVVVGMANTTLHHEHGMLATLMLGLWLTRRRRAGL